jgi:hypothetical protein
MPSSHATATGVTHLGRHGASLTRRDVLKVGTGAVAAQLLGQAAFRPAIAQPVILIDTCVVLCQFRDAGGNLTPVPSNRNFYQDYFFTRGTRGLSDYVPDITNGRLEFRGDAFGWFDIGHDLAEHRNLSGQAQRQRAYTWGLDAARAAGVAVDTFRHRVVFVNSNSDAGGVRTGVGMLIAHGPGADFNHVFMQHEFGRVLGLGESWSTLPDTAYDDDYCIMSAFTTGYRFQTTILGVPGQAGPRLNAVYVDQIGGFGPGQVGDIVPQAAQQRLRLTALSRPDLGGVLAARILPKGRQKNTYWAELRHPSNWDSGIPRASVAVHEARPNDPRSFLVIGPNAKALRSTDEKLVTPDQSLLVHLLEMEPDGLHATIGVTVRVPTFTKASSAASFSGQLNAGQLQLLPIDRNGRLWHTVRELDGSWPAPWGDVQQALAAGSPDIGALRSVACALGTNSELHLLTTDQQGGLWAGRSGGATCGTRSVPEAIRTSAVWAQSRAR